MQPKLLELSSLTNEYHYDVIGLCETWLDDSIPNDRLLIPGYSEPLRKDRNRRGGGVLLYFSESLPVVHRSDLEINGLELLWIDVKLRNESILIAECYRSPSQNSSEELTLFFEKFQSSLDLASSIPNSSIVILGDLNGPNRYWYPDSTTRQNLAGTSLFQFSMENVLTQLIDEPTYICNHTFSLLDIILTGSPGYFLNQGVLCPLSNCNHRPIFAILNHSISRDHSYSRILYDFKLLNEEEFKHALASVPFNESYMFDDFNDSVWA